MGKLELKVHEDLKRTVNTSVLNTDRSENTLHEKMPRGLGEQEMKSKPGKQVHSRRLWISEEVQAPQVLTMLRSYKFPYNLLQGKSALKKAQAGGW